MPCGHRAEPAARSLQFDTGQFGLECSRAGKFTLLPVSLVWKFPYSWD